MQLQQPLTKRPAINNFGNFLSQTQVEMLRLQFSQVSPYLAISNNNNLLPNNFEKNINPKTIDAHLHKTTLQQQQQMQLLAVKQQQLLQQQQILKPEISSQALAFAQIQQQAQQQIKRLQAFREAQFLQQRQLQQVFYVLSINHII